ncbi:prepilin-type N-terminal cleavage/methylation domain-containing protein [Candidatus Falkowbacteria bacterium]|jgi:prepilin-type N-terminal cleavage/methylation domain-containing protein|nr:prepilin-type N-terminal cleavage/methylation domain-containing protein [Candidatus Falkowbacteria bacterium]MBT7006918.1 prepilin-type N-terminal cleavage/methylation domain-containing protein [Candidatus Falkowbacteria bacterium]
MLKLKGYKSGFTLVEAIVSIAIIAIMATIVYFGINGFGDKKKFELDVNSFAANLQMLRTSALASAEIDSVIPTGYCFYIENQDATEYITYADLNGNYQYDANDEIIETVSLAFQTQIQPDPIDNNDFCFAVGQSIDVICDETGCGQGDTILLRLIFKETNEQKSAIISKTIGKIQIYEHAWPY